MRRANRFLMVFLAIGVPVLLTDSTAAEPGGDGAFAFRGVVPGVTSERELLQNATWGTPSRRQQLPDGSTMLAFQLRGYRQVGVTLRHGLVQTIDVVLPGGLGPIEAAKALNLGEQVDDEELPPAALVGAPLADALEGARYSAGRVALFTDRTSGEAKLMRVFAARIIEAVAAAPPPAPGDAAVAPVEPPPGTVPLVAASATSRQIVTTVAKMLPKYHLSRHPLDDEIGRRTTLLLLEALDDSKVYFTQNDVDRFEQNEESLDDQLKRGDLSVPYDIYNLYRQRLAESVALVERLLEVEHDFTQHEQIVTDPAKAAPAENALETREIWRQRVKYQLLVHLEAGADLAEAKKRTRAMYRNSLQRIQQQTEQDVLSIILNALCHAYDPNSAYYSPKAIEDFQISSRGQLFGIGAQLQWDQGYVRVSGLVPGGPVETHGRIEPGDRILAVGQGADGEMVDVVGKRLAETVELIRGPKGTTVRLLVLPKGQFEAAIHQIVRDRVEVSRIGSAILSTQQLPEGRAAKLGFVYLPSIYSDVPTSGDESDASYPTASGDLRRILGDFQNQGVDALILDLRNNGGGSVRETLNVAGVFVGEGTVVQMKDAQGNVRPFTTEGATMAWNGPLVVLTNKATVGGAEIVAAAIQDFRRGLLVGDVRSYGRGTAQSLLDVGAEAAGGGNAAKLGYLKVTNERFYRVDGRSTQFVGLAPDLVLPSVLNETPWGEQQQRYALKSDRLAAAQFAPLSYGIDADLIQQQNQQSAQRRSESPYFKKLAGRINDYRQQRQRGSVSMNKEQFFARQRSVDGDEEAAAISGIPQVKLDGYSSEILAITLDYLSRRQYAQAESDYKQARFDSAVAKYKASLAADRNNTNAHYKLAWTLATCSQARIRNGPLAVTHATRACQLDGYQKWHYLLGLAIADAEAGEFENAQKHLKTALEKAPTSQRATYSYLEQRFQNRQAYR